MVRGIRARKIVKRERAARVIQPVVRGFMGRRAYKKLWEAEQARLLLLKQTMAAKDIQRVQRGRIDRKWVAENKRMLAKEQRRLLAARKLQRWYRYQLIAKYLKGCIKSFCNLPKPPPRFGKLIEWPQAVGSKANEINGIFRKAQKRFWALQMVRYWKALEVIQKAYKNRLVKTYLKAIATNFTLPRLGKAKNAGVYKSERYGKSIAFPPAYTGATKAADPILQRMRMAWWAFQMIRYFRSVEILQRKYSLRLRRMYITAIAKTCNNEMKSNFSKDIKLPTAIAPGSKEISSIMVRMHHEDWGRRVCTALSDVAKATVHQKIQALGIFRGNKGWSAPYGYDFSVWEQAKKWNSKRDWKADYISSAVEQTKGQAKFREICQDICGPAGDDTVAFADVCIKVNKRGKSQQQVILVTDKNIYKYKVKNYERIKFGIPLSQAKAIYMSKLVDTFVVIQFASPYRDMVLNMGSHGEERFSELVTVLRAIVEELTHLWIPVSFVSALKYNNSRTETKVGDELNMTWVTAGEKDKWKPEEHGNCIFKSAGKGQSKIIYSEGESGV